MNQKIDHVLAFMLSGRFAHFRKFYTNSSSLSYLVPPRTVIMGVLASILRISRDGYYERFSEESCKISTSVAEGCAVKKSVQSVNMLHEKYHRFLEKGTGSGGNMHSQCKMELLMPDQNKPLAYVVYAAFPNDPRTAELLLEKIKSASPGYGAYLGQRQFRADLRFLHFYSGAEIEFLEQSTYLDSICLQENVISFSADHENSNVHVVVEQMPVHMKPVQTKGQPGRETVSVKRVLFERTGKRLYGNFKNCWRIGDKVVSFY
jgi:CRISPR-associated protein Cas5h